MIVYALNPIGKHRRTVRRRPKGGTSMRRKRSRRRASAAQRRARLAFARRFGGRKSRRRNPRRSTARRRSYRRRASHRRRSSRRRANPFLMNPRRRPRRRATKRWGASRGGRFANPRRRSYRRNPFGGRGLAGFTGLQGPLGLLPSINQAKTGATAAAGFVGTRFVAGQIMGLMTKLPPALIANQYTRAGLKVLAHGAAAGLVGGLLGRRSSSIRTGAQVEFGYGLVQALLGPANAVNPGGGLFTVPGITPLLGDDYEVESDMSDYVTEMNDYVTLQDPYGGPTGAATAMLSGGSPFEDMGGDSPYEGP